MTRQYYADPRSTLLCRLWYAVQVDLVTQLGRPEDVNQSLRLESVGCLVPARAASQIRLRVSTQTCGRVEVALL